MDRAGRRSGRSEQHARIRSGQICGSGDLQGADIDADGKVTEKENRRPSPGPGSTSWDKEKTGKLTRDSRRPPTPSSRPELAPR